MKNAPLILTASALAFGFIACRRDAKSKAPAPTPGSAQAAAQAPIPGGATATGTVVETMDASSYTYVQVKTPTETVWAAGPQTKVAVGDKVTIPLVMPMANFHSSTLNRTFPTIYFTSRIFKEGELPGVPAGH